MERKAKLADEIQILRSLCDVSIAREARLKLLHTIGPGDFIGPEHQVVYESVRTLLLKRDISANLLLVHLNNRGFPDTDVEKYFSPAQSERIPKGKAEQKER